MKKLLALVIIGFVAVPVAPVLAFLLAPFWKGLEESTGIESWGHSGPALWCYVMVCLLVWAVSFMTWLRYDRKNPSKS
jgi:hypothetical protein